MYPLLFLQPSLCHSSSSVGSRTFSSRLCISPCVLLYDFHICLSHVIKVSAEISKRPSQPLQPKEDTTKFLSVILAILIIYLRLTNIVVLCIHLCVHPGVCELLPEYKIWLATCFCTPSFFGIQPFIEILSMTAFAL